MTKPNQYSIALADDKTKGFPGFQAAREAAEQFAATELREFQVVHIPTEAVAFVATPVPAGQQFAPWERVETPKFEARHIPGYTPAYTRKRIDVVVYRKNDKGGWLVVQSQDMDSAEFCKTTKIACNLTSEMRATGKRLAPAPVEEPVAG